jgi:hypothetical protein
MKKLQRLMTNLGERGQVAMIVAGCLPILLGMAGMSIDVATYMGDRRHLQNSADSMALAGAQVLPDEDAAQDIAEDWADRNGIDMDDVTLTTDITGDAPVVRVRISRPHKFTFMKVLGIDERDVGARAAAVKVSFGGGAGIVPWSVTQATVDWAGNGQLITMKYDSTGGSNGNFGAIRIDGPGASTYEDSVMFGSDTTACAATAPNCVVGSCPGSYPDICAETSPTCDGPECTPQTGNVIGPTRDGTDFRMDYTCDNTNPCGTQRCDTFADTFGTPDADGKYHVHPDCNPWTDGPGACTSATDFCSRRVIIIPVVDGFGNGASDPAEIQRFALVYLEGYEGGKCQGNSCEIKGRFVKADISLSALAGIYDEDASIHFTRLSE